MRARDFDCRLEVYRPEIVRDEFKAINHVYVSQGVIAAYRVKNDGRKVVVVGEQYSYYTAEYNIRDGNDVREGWRVKELDSGVVYEVAARMHDRQKRMYILKCIGVNPNDDSERNAEGAEGDLP